MGIHRMLRLPRELIKQKSALDTHAKVCIHFVWWGSEDKVNAWPRYNVE